jgi:hypothetical protein
MTSPSDSAQVEMVGGPHCGGTYFHHAKWSLPKYLPMPSAKTQFTHVYTLRTTEAGQSRYVHIRVLKKAIK